MWNLILNLFRNRLINLATKIIASIKWKQDEIFTEEQLKELYDRLSKDYYIIATRRDNFLSCFFINLAHFIYTWRWGYYTHVLMNLEDEVQNENDFRLIEAAERGVEFITFKQMYTNCDAIALLKPKDIKLEEWTKTLDNVKTHLGKPYDTLFNISCDHRLSCVELVRNALMTLPNYWYRFSHFESTIAHSGNLTPQMFIESPNFEVVWEIRPPRKNKCQ